MGEGGIQVSDCNKKIRKLQERKKKKDKGYDLEMEFEKELAKSGLLKKEPAQTNGGGGNTSI